MTQRTTGKYPTHQRVQVQDEKWETQSSEYKVARLYLKDALGQIQIVLEKSEPYVYFQTDISRKCEGEFKHEDDNYPVCKAMVLIAQLEQQNGINVLTHLADQTFRVDWIVSGEAEALEKDLAIDWSHTITRVIWSIANALICLTLAIILIWRWRSKRAISELE